MMRRVHVERVQVGRMALDAAQAHHVRNVLRLAAGERIEVFDAAGGSGVAVIDEAGPDAVILRVDAVVAPALDQLEWNVAAAVPKGARADWLVEKLSELGASAFIPLITGRSVVRPEGHGKTDRWNRLAIESARQSRRAGLMRIEPMVPVGEAIEAALRPRVGPDQVTRNGCGWYLSTVPPTVDAMAAVAAMPRGGALTLFIGPEGGWTEAEIAVFQQRGLTGVSLGRTILRVETAAIAAAAIVAATLAYGHQP